MREIERKPIPLKSHGLTGDLKRLKEPTDSFLIENKGLKRAVLYATASRLGIRITTQAEGDGLRVWRNFEGESPFTDIARFQAEQMHKGPVDEIPMTRTEKLDNLRDIISDIESGKPSPFIETEADELWIDDGVTYENGEVLYWRHKPKQKPVIWKRESDANGA